MEERAASHDCWAVWSLEEAVWVWVWAEVSCGRWELYVVDRIGMGIRLFTALSAFITLIRA